MKTEILNLLSGDVKNHSKPLVAKKKSYKILVVDDEPLIRETVQMVLEKEGHHVSLADGGDQCFSLLGKEEFDIILLDLQMPGMDGLSILKKIREKNFFSAILIMSAKGSIDHAVEAMKHGAADYLQKPFTFDKLRDVIEKTAREHLFGSPISESDKNLRKIGKYVLIEEIGKGSSSTIYKGVHLHLRKPVAIKILHENLTNSASFTKRFYHEAKTTASLSHPNIINVSDYGNEGHIFYLVMELMKGHTLHHHFSKNERLPLRIVVLTCIEVCKALEYAHQKGVIHRDIKLQNIFISDDGIVKLLDFGIAHCLKIEDTALTIPGCIIGTPAFMSPEQAHGDKLTPASDLFSLGVVLYALATLHLPFRGKTAAATIHNVSLCDFPEPKSLNPEIDSKLNSIIIKCMHSDPKKRYSSANALKLALKKWFADNKPDTTLDILKHYFQNQKVNFGRIIRNIDRLFS